MADDSQTFASIRRITRELLAVTFWLHAIFATSFITLPHVVPPVLPRYIYNVALFAFIVNCSLFSNKGWWAIAFDLLYIYFWPFIVVAKIAWKLLKIGFRYVKSRAVVVNPNLIADRPPVATSSRVIVERTQANTPQGERRFGLQKPLSRLLTQFALLWALLILTIDYKPFIAVAVVITLFGAGKALYSLWDLLSDRSIWISK
jgi:hypothetical protein